MPSRARAEHKNTDKPPCVNPHYFHKPAPTSHAGLLVCRSCWKDDDGESILHCCCSNRIHASAFLADAAVWYYRLARLAVHQESPEELCFRFLYQTNANTAPCLVWNFIFTKYVGGVHAHVKQIAVSLML